MARNQYSSSSFSTTVKADAALWKGKFYPICDIPDLPRDVSCDGDVTLTLDYARHSEVTSSLYDMVQEAGECGDNVGVDEYSKEHLQSIIEFAEIFVARWPTGSDLTKSGTVAAFIVIRPSDVVRTTDPCLADVRVFRARNVPDSVYFRLIESAVQLTVKLDCGYTDCAIAVSSTCRGLLGELIGRQNFVPIVTVPRTVNMARTLGLVDSILLHKNLDGNFRPPRSLDQVLCMLAAKGIQDGVADDTTPGQKVQSLTVPFLPRTFLLGKNRLPAVVRNVCEKDYQVAYDITKGAIDRGEGYSQHSYPNFAWFKRSVLTSLYCIVLEHDGKVIGWYAVGNSPLARQHSPGSCSSAMLIDKAYQDHSIGKGVIHIGTAVERSVGYTTALHQMIANNARQKKNVVAYYDLIGILPRAGYVAVAGAGKWVDRYVGYRNLEGLATLEDIGEDLSATRSAPVK